MSFITLTTLDDERIFVRADSISEIWQIEEAKRTPAHTGIAMTNKDTWRIKEAPEEVIRRFKEATTPP
jgi:uncharacterized protein YlzI (FlbEa/FlbD family)